VFGLFPFHEAARPAHPEDMLPDEVETGQTYRVHVANRDNPAHLLACAPEHSVANLLLFTETLDAVVDFDLTVVATGQLLGSEPAVTGVRVSETSHVRTPLPTEAAERLGLSTNVDYFVEGVLKDAATGQLVSLPSDQTLTVPVRWLHPLL
jgi:hypothetical protein